MALKLETMRILGPEASDAGAVAVDDDGAVVEEVADAASMADTSSASRLAASARCMNLRPNKFLDNFAVPSMTDVCVCLLDGGFVARVCAGLVLFLCMTWCLFASQSVEGLCNSTKSV